MDFAKAFGRYDPKALNEGFSTLPDSEEVFYINDPALGLKSVQDDSDVVD